MTHRTACNLFELRHRKTYWSTCDDHSATSASPTSDRETPALSNSAGFVRSDPTRPFGRGRRQVVVVFAELSFGLTRQKLSTGPALRCARACASCASRYGSFESRRALAIMDGYRQYRRKISDEPRDASVQGDSQCRRQSGPAARTARRATARTSITSNRKRAVAACSVAPRRRDLEERSTRTMMNPAMSAATRSGFIFLRDATGRDGIQLRRHSSWTPMSSE